MIFEKIQEIIAQQFAVEASSITVDTAFVDDLGADSLDIVELTMALEEAFELPEFAEEELKALQTAGDLADYVAQHVND